MKNNMKNWISLFVVASLATACGAIKKDNKSSPSITSSNPVSAITNIPPAVLSLNNLYPHPQTWAANGGATLVLIGEVKKSDAPGIAVQDNTAIELEPIGTLEAEWNRSTYPQQTDDEKPQPVNSKELTPYQQIKVYLVQPADDVNAMAFAVSLSDYNSLKPNSETVEVSYDKEPTCNQLTIEGWVAPAGLMIQYGNENGTVATCDGFGTCTYQSMSNSVVTGWQWVTSTNTVSYADLMKSAPESTCVNEAMLTKKCNYQNTGAIDQYNIVLDSKYENIAQKLQIGFEN